MKNKIVIALIIILFIALVVVSFLWRYTVNSLSATKNQLYNAQIMIETLQTDNKNLIEYVTQKDNKIKELEQKYTESLNNIPRDQCGDTKPSQELLDYFIKVYKQ